MQQADPSSNRSKRRSKRTFTGSRPNRRAQRRLDDRLAGYRKTIDSSKSNETAYTRPGALKAW